MDFSELLKYDGHCAFSPDSKYIATTDKYRLFLREAESLEVVHIYTCLDVISKIEWSCDSKYIMCAQYKRRIVQVWSLEQPDWTCKIDEGLAGLTYAQWAPDGRHILTSTEFQLRLTIWSLVNKTAVYIKFPKFSDRGLEFSHDGKYLAVVERRDFKDLVGLYYTETWELIKHFEVETEDLHNLKWAPNDRAICVYDSCLEYRLLVYSSDGRKLTNYQAYEHALGIKSVAWAPSGQFIAIGSYDQHARIMNNITWKVVSEYHHRPVISNPMVVVYTEQPVDSKVEIRPSLRNSASSALHDPNDPAGDDDDTASNAALATDDVNQSMVSNAGSVADEDKDAAFRRKLREIQLRTQASSGVASKAPSSSLSKRGSNTDLSLSRSALSLSQTLRRDASGKLLPSSTSTNAIPALAVPTKYVVSETPYEIFQVKPDPDKPNPRLGVGTVAWSFNDRFLATKNDNMPCTLWIWDTQRLSLSCIINQLNPITAMKWSPTSETLAVSSDNSKLYLWSPQGASIVDVPAVNFAIKSLKWNEDGRSLVLQDKFAFCGCYLQPTAFPPADSAGADAQ